MKIKDRITLGAISGVAASVVGELISRLQHRAGWSDIRYHSFASLLFVPKGRIHTPPAQWLGLAVNATNASLVSVLLTYLLSATGKDKAWLKGMGVGAVTWVMAEGLLGRYVLRARSNNPTAPLSGLLSHLVVGVVNSLMIASLGDDRLFPPRPDSSVKRGRQVPLVSAGMR